MKQDRNNEGKCLPHIPRSMDQNKTANTPALLWNYKSLRWCLALGLFWLRMFSLCFMGCFFFLFFHSCFLLQHANYMDQRQTIPRVTSLCVCARARMCVCVLAWPIQAVFLPLDRWLLGSTPVSQWPMSTRAGGWNAATYIYPIQTPPDNVG